MKMTSIAVLSALCGVLAGSSITSLVVNARLRKRLERIDVDYFTQRQREVERHRAEEDTLRQEIHRLGGAPKLDS